MLIDNYLESYIKVQNHKNNIMLSTEEARALVFAKASMFFFKKDSNDVIEIYTDEDCCYLSPNPVQADSSGVFPEVHVYVDEYWVEIQDTRAKTIFQHVSINNGNT